MKKAPKEAARLDRVIPRINEGFQTLVDDLPNAVKRDVDRARASVRQYTGNAIKGESDGKTVRFLSESRRLETTLLVAAGGAAAIQTSVVAGAGFEPATFGL